MHVSEQTEVFEVSTVRKQAPITPFFTMFPLFRPPPFQAVPVRGFVPIMRISAFRTANLSKKIELMPMKSKKIIISPEKHGRL